VYIYSSLWAGGFFIFLLGAGSGSPVRLFFKEHEEDIRSRKAEAQWKQKVYLYPAILQRKWLDYKFRDRFISYVKYDNILPLELSCPVLNPTGVPLKVILRSGDKDYRQLTIGLLNSRGETVLERAVDGVRTGKPGSISLSVPVPGVYTIQLTIDGTDYRKTNIIFFKEGSLFMESGADDSRFRELASGEGGAGRETWFYCSSCGSRVFALEAGVNNGYVYKNYIPFKEYLDIDGFGFSYISEFITRLPHSGKHKGGLIHLLNMLRLASIEDEITIVTNLFKEDPEFAYFITHRLFLFSMIPIMENRELQKILSRIDDEMIARSLKGESGPLRKKVLGNISRRRARIIEDMMQGPQKKDDESVKEDMHRIIKTYFEEGVGRVLKIPESTQIRYTINPSGFGLEEACMHHGGDIIAVSGKNMHLFPNLSANKSCTPYDSEAYKDPLFTLYAVSESAILLRSCERLRYVMVHIYDWSTEVEYCEIFEHLTPSAVIPLRRVSSELILTVGAIDGTGRPREQVIRLKLH